MSACVYVVLRWDVELSRDTEGNVNARASVISWIDVRPHVAQSVCVVDIVVGLC